MIEQYVTHAIDDFSSIIKNAKHVRDRQMFEYLVHCLSVSEKVSLPEYGYLFDCKTDLVPYKEFCLPPYPITVFQWSSPEIHENPGVQDQLCSRRIALVVRMESYQWIYSIAYYDSARKWVLGLCAFCASAPPDVSEASGANTKAVKNWWAQTGLKNHFTKRRAFKFQAIPVYVDAEKVSEENRSVMAMDSKQELDVAFQAMVGMNAVENIVLDYVYPPKALALRRERKKRTPFYSYHVLKLPTFHYVHEREDVMGTHVSPRFHLRRGHIRRLHSGNLTWVRSTTVGDPDLGIVSKDYQMVI